MESLNVKTQQQFLAEIDQLKSKVTKLEESGLKSLFPLENSLVCIKIVDLDFNLQYMSGFELKTIRTKKASDFYGKPYPFDFLPDIFKTIMLNDLEKVKKTGKTTSHEASIFDENKNVLWLSSTLIPIKNDEDNVDYIIVASVDTTAYKQAEIEIQKNQDFNESLLKTSPDIIYVFDIIEKKNIYNNEGITKILGYSSKDIYEFGENLILKLMHPDDYKIYLSKILPQYHLVKDKEIIKHEYRMKHKNGNWRWIHSKESIFKRKANGKPLHIFGIAGDITERKIAEKKIKENEEFLSITGEIAQVGGWEYFLESQLMKWTKETKRILEVESEGELNLDTAVNFYHPDDRELAWEFINLAMDYGRPFDFEARVITAKGNERLTRTQGKFVTENGKCIRLYGVLHDITESKLAKQKLEKSEQDLLEAQKIAKIGTYNLDLKTLIAKTTSIGRDMVGIDQDCEMTYTLWKTISHPEDSPNNQKELDRCIETGDKFDLEFRILTKDTKELKWVHGLGKIIYKNGIATNFLGTMQDITQQKNAELILQSAYDEVKQLKKHLEVENIYLKKEISLAFNYEDMVYSSEEISNVLNQVEQVATTDATVLILGETGTGKELIAKAIHNTSLRNNNSLIRVNCAAIPSELIESELFGHLKGSFTGAINDRIGKFELADGGTLFLDEIGELPLPLQPKLLRAIQEGEIEPIGSSKIHKLNVRIVAATNKDLKKETEEGRFRSDLYFRLNVFPIVIPPLRKRIEDFPVLIDHFVNKYCKRHRKDIKYISDLTLQKMKVYTWPGNVRELENLIERAVIISNQDLLIIEEFSDSSLKKIAIKRTRDTLEEVQRNHIIKTLNETSWKINGNCGAAQLLDIKPSTLRDRMKKFGIERL